MDRIYCKYCFEQFWDQQVKENYKGICLNWKIKDSLLRSEWTKRSVVKNLLILTANFQDNNEVKIFLKSQHLH
jgi:hypothetical protein